MLPPHVIGRSRFSSNLNSRKLVCTVRKCYNNTTHGQQIRLLNVEFIILTPDSVTAANYFQKLKTSLIFHIFHRNCTISSENLHAWGKFNIFLQYLLGHFNAQYDNDFCFFKWVVCVLLRINRSRYFL